MDVMTWLLTVSCSVVGLVYLWKVLNWVWFRPKKLEKLLRQQGFVGNSYQLLHGDFKEISKISREALSEPMTFSNDIMARVIPIYHNARKNYGEKSVVWLGPKPAVFITEAKVVREIMSRHYVFHRSSNPAARMLARGLSAHENEKWAKHRKILNPAFHLDKLKEMVPSFYLSCADMLSKWDKIVGSEGSSELDVWPYLSEMASDAISRTAFGSSYEEGRKIFHLQKEQAQRSMEARVSIQIPGWRFLPTKANRRMREIVREVETTLIGIINKRMEGREGSKDDLLGLLLESNSKEIKEHGDGSGLSMEEVIGECKLFYFAGQETTASLLVWTMILLSKHEDWQARARDEVLQVLGRGKPGYHELNQLKIVNMILHEVLRLYPPGPNLSRVTTQDETRLGKLTLPEGVQLMLPVLALHNDTRIWGEEADRFEPERFREGVSKATEGEMAYFPFGWGPRTCLGQNFAMLEAKMAMAMILQCYSFQLSPSYSHAPFVKITLQPQHGAHLILTKI